MPADPRYKAITRGRRRVETNLLLLSLCTYVCVRVFLSHSEANYFGGGACYCGCAAVHVGQTASANLHCLWDTLAKHHLVLATVSLGPYAYKVSPRVTTMGMFDLP